MQNYITTVSETYAQEITDTAVWRRELDGAFLFSATAWI